MTRLERLIQQISINRGIDETVMKGAFAEFLKALDETQFKAWNQLDGSVLAQTYLALGDEAAYHLGGLLTHQGDGHEPGDVITELQYIDSRLKRFHTTVERWQTELDWEIEDSK
jgi:hypothetical protein